MKNYTPFFLIVCILICITSLVTSCQDKNRRLTECETHQACIYTMNEKQDMNMSRDSVFIHDTIFKTDIVTKYIERTINHTDTLYIEYVIPLIPELDSIETVKAMHHVLANGYISIPHKYKMEPTLSLWKNLEVLPYLIYLFSQKTILPKCNYLYLYDLKDFCSHYIDDKRLLDLGQSIIDRICSLNLKIPDHSKKRLEFERYKNYKMEKAMVDGRLMNIDSLRVRTIVYQDLDALKILEQYYAEKDYSLGIAIYYKLLLGYDGNGNLAERFYKTLQPYVNKMPDLQNVIHETLLRAALCDRDKRAQELCDSLGFSLCDYKIDIPWK